MNEPQPQDATTADDERRATERRFEAYSDVFAAFARHQSAVVSQRIKDGLRRKAEAGGTIGRPPIGYRNAIATDAYGRHSCIVEIDAPRANLIRWVFYRFGKHDTPIATLAKETAEQGLTTRPTPKHPSRPINERQLQRILTNPYYAGKVTYAGKTYQGQHEALVDPATWSRVQNRLSALTEAGTGTPNIEAA